MSQSPLKTLKNTLKSKNEKNRSQDIDDIFIKEMFESARLNANDIDLEVYEQVAQLTAVSNELSSEAKKRLEGIDSWRRMNEEPYSCGRMRRQQPSVDITEQMAPVLERHMFEAPMSAVEPDQFDETGFIIRHFDDSSCFDFKPAKHQQAGQDSVCSICGLTEEFHKIQEETDGTPVVLGDYQDGKKDGLGSTSPAKRPLLRLNMSHTRSVPSRSATRLPAMTFGSIIIPHRFLGRIREDSLGGSYKGQFTRKYLRFAAEGSSDRISFLWELMTHLWNLNPPTIVMSVTGGSVKSMESNVRKSLSEAINRIVSKTDVWIISDGRNYGASKFLGEMLNEGSEQYAADQSSNKTYGQKDCVPVLIGVNHWGSLRRKALLMSISSPAETRSSRYFYSMEYKLAREEHSRILNPYQSVYLLLDNGHRYPDDSVQDFRTNLDKYFASKTFGRIEGRFTMQEYISKTTLPVLTLVLGGDGEKTIDHVLQALKSKYPVIVVKGSSSVPTLLAELFYALEDKVPRSSRPWDDETSTWDEREDRVFQNYTSRFKEKIKSIFNICTTETAELDTQAQKEEILFQRILLKIQEIMKYRFYITVVDCEMETGENLCNNILRGMYKGYSRLSGLTIALKACRPDFLQALFDRSDEPSQQEYTKYFVTVSLLNDLHRENFSRTSSLTKILKMMCKRESYDVKRKPHRNFLPLVGRILQLLMGPRYKLMYHDTHFLELKDKGDFGKKRWQVWHLFLWSILTGKPGMTRFFVAQSAAPLGAALIAYHLYSRLARWANKGYEEELKTYLQNCAGQFQQLAINLLDNMYENDAEGAYRVLVSELPFDLGPYVTPFVIADDAKAMDFISQGCCQTYLQRVWKGNMVVETPNWRSWPMFFFFPFLSVPWIHFYDSSLNRISETDTTEATKKLNRQSEIYDNVRASKLVAEADDMSELTLDDNMENMSDIHFSGQSRHKHGDSNYGSRIDRFKFFLTAPITKFYSGMISYMCFLALLSYFVLSDLKPFVSFDEISAVEWTLIVWNLSLILEEIVQVFGVNDTGPLYGVPRKNLWKAVWHNWEIFKIRIFPLVMYLKTERWNTIDVAINGFFVISFLLRFTLPMELFQLARFIFAITVIFSYFRLLHFWFVLPSIGPRVIAIQMMITELLKFLSVLIVFMLGFGVAFEAILNPNQPFTAMTVVDIFWRTFWQMFGELFLDDTVGMGREVSLQSCHNMASANNETGIHCLSWAAPVMLGVYLLIANVLLLNLLIATFSQAYEDVKSKAHTVYLYNLYNLIQECYYQTALPPPLSLLQRFVLCIMHIANVCRKPVRPVNVIVEDSFRIKATAAVSRLQKKACDSIKPDNSSSE